MSRSNPNHSCSNMKNHKNFNLHVKGQPADASAAVTRPELPDKDFVSCYKHAQTSIC